MAYVPRVVDAELRCRLGSVGAVVIEGAKACGKTATARQVAASELRVDTDPRVLPATSSGGNAPDATARARVLISLLEGSAILRSIATDLLGDGQDR